MIDEVHLAGRYRRQLPPAGAGRQPGDFPQIAGEVRGTQIDVQLFRGGLHDFAPIEAARPVAGLQRRRPSPGQGQQVGNPMAAAYQRVDALQRNHAGAAEFRRQLGGDGGHPPAAIVHQRRRPAGDAAGRPDLPESVKDVFQRAGVQFQYLGLPLHPSHDGGHFPGVYFADVAEVLGQNQVGGGGGQAVVVQLVGVFPGLQQGAHGLFHLIAGQGGRVDFAAAEHRLSGGLRRVVAQVADAHQRILQAQGIDDFRSARQQRADFHSLLTGGA